METIYKRKMNEASALCPNPAINNTMGCDFGEFNYKLTHSEGMLTKELPFDNSHAGVVSMWLGNNFPMTRLFKQEWDLNNKEDTSASNSVSDGRTSPNHIDITPCSSLETFGLLANICCSMALRGNPYLHQGALKQWYNKVSVS